MTVRYVGIGGNDASNGTSWATRKLTLNGAEDTPVAAGDTVYVGPGTYRELLTCDVSGGAGTPITYIGDVDGSHTDGIGGMVRVTGSDNDTTTTRARCFYVATKNYRAFQGFNLDLCSTGLINVATGTNLTVQDCVFGNSAGNAILFSGGTGHLMQRCLFYGQITTSIYLSSAATIDNTAIIIQNCVFICGMGSAIMLDRFGGVTIKNNFISGYGGGYGIRSQYSPAAGQVNNANNNIICHCNTGVRGEAATDITDDYNTVYGCSTAYTTIVAGAHSNIYAPLIDLPILLAGFRYPWNFPSLSPYSPLRAIAGTGEATDDIFGRARPATAAKNSWGAVQFSDTLRETTTKRTGSASIKFEDAGRHQIFVPTTNVSTTFSVYCYREADYAGTNPQMVIKQPGVADTVVTDAAAASQWNLLTATLTPAAFPPYCVVELVSNNTNTANAATNDVFFDDLTVT